MKKKNTNISICDFSATSFSGLRFPRLPSAISAFAEKFADSVMSVIFRVACLASLLRSVNQLEKTDLICDNFKGHRD